MVGEEEPTVKFTGLNSYYYLLRILLIQQFSSTQMTSFRSWLGVRLKLPLEEDRGYTREEVQWLFVLVAFSGCLKVKHFLLSFTPSKALFTSKQPHKWHYSVDSRFISPVASNTVIYMLWETGTVQLNILVGTSDDIGNEKHLVAWSTWWEVELFDGNLKN